MLQLISHVKTIYVQSRLYAS